MARDTRDNPSTEMWAGLAAMFVALPSAIAFGLVIYSPIGPAYAAQGAIAGILGTIALGLVAPLAGSTPRLITAPCAPAAAVMAAVAGQFLASGEALRPEQVPTLLMLVALLAGALQMMFGRLGGGRVIKFIPYPVVAGYLSGVGALIFLGQLPRLFGLPAGTQAFAALVAPGSWRWPALIVGIVTMVSMFVAPRITRAVPPTIVALGAGGLAYAVLAALQPELRTITANPLVIGRVDLGDQSTLGAITARWAASLSLDLDHLRLILMPALTLAVLVSIDTLKTCVVLDALTRGRHNSNRELIAQGLGNAASAIAGGIPGAGQMGGTLVNLQSGGRTRVSGMLEGAFALAAFLVFGGLLAWIPVSALAGILIVVALRMVDVNVVQLLRQRSTVLDFAVTAAVTVTAIMVDLVSAAGVGLGLATLFFVREQIRGSVVRRKSYGNHRFSKRRRLPEEIGILEKRGDQTVICELQGNLFFGTTDQLLSELDADLKARLYVILDMRRVQFVDFTATHILKQIEGRLSERGGYLLFSELPPNLPTGQDLEAYFGAVGLVRPSGRVKMFNELDEALEWTENEILLQEHLLRAAHEKPLALEEIDMFRGLDATVLDSLRHCVEDASFEVGERVFREGDRGDELFVIRRGAVKIVLPLADGKQYHLATFARGDCFGDMAFLDRATRSADAIAATPVDLYRLSRARFDTIAKSDPPVAEAVFAQLARVLAFRLRQTDAEVRTLKES